MSRNNDVCRTLFLPDNPSIVDLDARVGDLDPGEWGVFDYDTGLAVDVSNGVPNNFFIAYVGDGDLGTVGEIYTTAATHTQKRNVRYYTTNSPTDAEGQVLTLDNLIVQSGPDATNYDYAIKMDFRGNTEVYQRFGMNQATKFATGSTRCVGSSGASDYPPAELMAQWINSLSGDTDQFMDISVDGGGVANGPITYTASGVSGRQGVWTDNAGNITKEEALAAIRAGTDDMVMTITMQSFSQMYYFCNVNPKYFHQRQIAAIPSLSGGSCKWGDFVQTTKMIYEKGRGYDVQELEYLAGGFTGKPGPYRQSRLNGLPFMDYEYLAVRNEPYTICVFSYDQLSVGGWMEYLNNQSTYFILPEAPNDTDANHPKTTLDIIATEIGLTEIKT